MKTSSLVQSYFKEQTDNLLLAFEKPAESLSEDDFHLIRVHIKRIKALLTVLEKTNPKFRRKKYFVPFKIIFRQAGKIRDLQVQLLMLKAYPWNTAIDQFERELNQQLAAEKMNLYQSIQPSLIRDVQKKASTITTYLAILNGKSVNRFLVKREMTIRKLLTTSDLKPSLLHELRKRIKELYYLQKMMAPKNNRLVNTDHFQELLGKWHDGRVLLEGLKNFMKSGLLGREDRIIFESLKAKISNDNQQLYTTILNVKAGLLELLD